MKFELKEKKYKLGQGTNYGQSEGHILEEDIKHTRKYEVN